MSYRNTFVNLGVKKKKISIGKNCSEKRKIENSGVARWEEDWIDEISEIIDEWRYRIPLTSVAFSCDIYRRQNSSKVGSLVYS